MPISMEAAVCLSHAQIYQKYCQSGALLTRSRLKEELSAFLCYMLAVQYESNLIAWNCGGKLDS
jgi:hypothetical protein